MNNLLWRGLVAFLLLAADMTPVASAAEHLAGSGTLFERLVRQGVQVSDDLRVRLPPPALPDGLEREDQQERVTRIAGRYGWKTFVRNSPVAPFVLEQSYLKDSAGNRVGHAIDLWFVVHGRLSDFEDQRLGEDFFGRQRSEMKETDEGKLRELTDSELSQAGIEEYDRDRERYVVAEVPLMNRVHVRAVGHAAQSRQEQSLLVAWELDHRFENDAELASRWYPLETTELGERQKGQPQPYRGYGGYVKITELHEPTGALLIEAHVVFHEPQDWFSGSNFLRSKTPLMVRENVDKLRRKLARLEPRGP